MFIQFSGEILKLGERTAGILKLQKEIEGCSRTDREEKERFDIYIHRQVCYIGWQEI